MDDFSALASRIAGSVGELRGCIILSRDGMVLGAYPEDDAAVKPAWLRFAALGEPEKGFVEFGDEVWTYARRGPYAAFAVSPGTVRPGVVMDMLEQALLTAEESRTKRETLKVPDAAGAPSGKPRTSLHKEPAAKPDGPVAVGAESAPGARSSKAPEGEPGPDAQAAPTQAEAPAPVEAEDAGEIDRVMLAQEFSRLLQVDGEGDEDETA